MTTFQIKHRFTHAVVFECELTADLENASFGVKLGFAVKAAVRADANLADAYLARAYLADANLARAYLAGANLAGANLARANLADANLARAYLADANLADANLAGANLARANLADANLADANLARAYLADANLEGANLARAYLAGANLARAYLADANLARAKWREGITISKAPVQIYGLTYQVTILDTHMQIGCELHTHAEWADCDDRRICAMDGKRALTFWRNHKAALIALCAVHAPQTAVKAA